MAVLMLTGCNTCLDAAQVPLFHPDDSVARDVGTDVTADMSGPTDDGFAGHDTNGGDMPHDTGCMPASVEALCAEASVECGMATVNDPECGDLRTVVCGECPEVMACLDGACACPVGYERVGDSCMDVDDCANAPCSENAVCEDGLQSFTCTCEDGHYGDGVSCDPLPMVAASSSMGSRFASFALGPITPDPDHLYVVGVSLRTTVRSVQSVSGLGATWTRLVAGCDPGSLQRLEVWIGRDPVGVPSEVDITLDGPPLASAVVVTAVANAGSNVTASVFNQTGSPGGCGGNSVLVSSYANQVTTNGDAGLLYAVTATFGSTHTPDAPFQAEAGINDGYYDAGIASMSHRFNSRETVDVGGMFAPSATWISAVVEIPAE